jgi:light-regulated signal transduction histidine kinase (bacteriophytochrome)
MRRLEEVLPRSGALDNLEIEQEVADKGLKTMLLSTRRMNDYKDQLDPRADKFIRYAVEGAHRVETLLRDLREYWSVNEQKLDGPISPIDCNEVVDKAIH